MTLIDFPSVHADSHPSKGGVPRDVLIVVHRREAQPGNVGHWLRAQGYRLDMRCPRFGDPLPETLENHAGVIVFGGPMSANDPDGYLRREIDWLRVPLMENKPYFGICLGAQMLAKHLGAAVSHHAEGLVEVGYYPIAATDEARSLLPWPDQVYHWHCEGFAMPAGAKLIASGAAFENQAFQYGSSAFGVQFHPEMTLAMIHRWTTVAGHRLTQAGARPKQEHIAAHCIHGTPLKEWLGRFLHLWLASGAIAERHQGKKLSLSSAFCLGAVTAPF